MIDRARCYFQAINIGDGDTARASLNQVRSAANALYVRCATVYPSQGGIVKNIGMLSRFPSEIMCLMITVSAEIA